MSWIVLQVWQHARCDIKDHGKSYVWFLVKILSFIRRFHMWKVTISFVMSVCPSVRMEQLDSHWTDFQEIWYLCIFRKPVKKIQVLLK
jgi:hypothetical protein